MDDGINAIQNIKRDDIRINNDDDQNEPFEILNKETDAYDNSFKVIVLGNSGVGKSCMTIKAAKNIYEEQVYPTIGFEFYPIFIKIKNKITKLQIWDTCGQETYRSLVANFYRNSQIAIMVYSIDDRKSFEDLLYWLKILKANSNRCVKLMLVGNKSDIEDRKVTFEEAEKFKKDYNFEEYLENTSKNGNTPKEIFCKAAKILLKENEKIKVEKKEISHKTCKKNMINESNKIHNKNEIYSNNDRVTTVKNSPKISLRDKQMFEKNQQNASSGNC
jgi:small GTP-binding protein